MADPNFNNDRLTASDATGFTRGLMQYLPVVMPRASGDPKGRPLTSTLHDIDIGKTVRVKEICADPSVCQRLREMGFCEYIEVCKIAHGGALICRVGSGRMVLSQRLAKNIVVEAIDPPTTGKEK